MVRTKMPGRGKNFPELPKIFFSGLDIKHGIRWPYAARCLWCSRYLPDGQPSDYLDILKGVEKQLGGTNIGISVPTSPLVVPKCL